MSGAPPERPPARSGTSAADPPTHTALCEAGDAARLSPGTQRGRRSLGIHGREYDEIPAVEGVCRRILGRPEIQEALAAARVMDLVQPTPKVGESYDDLLDDRSADEDFDAKPYFNGRRFGFVRLQHLPGNRAPARRPPPTR